MGPYRIHAVLGTGGMGVVYLADDERTDRRVALKVLADNLGIRPDVAERFRREIDALARCSHPNVVALLDSGDWYGKCYYAMEFVEGADLGCVGRHLARSGSLEEAVATCQRLAKGSADGRPCSRGPGGAGRHAGCSDLPPPADPRLLGRIAGLFQEAAFSLEHLHARGIIHRDVKPGNLMVPRSADRVVLIDMGLSRLGACSELSQKGESVVGTLRYMAPEQLTGDPAAVDHRADIYGMGATFYEVLTGRPFLAGQNAARLIDQMLHKEPVAPRRHNPALSQGLETVLLRATGKDPATRYPDARAVAAALEPFALRPLRVAAPQTPGRFASRGQSGAAARQA
ncbi:MAG TPA: serine/threonine-protein kinase [Planctomycetota bacterium]